MSEMTPTAVANQALDAIGWTATLGEIEDGSHHAQILLRAYRQCLQQLLRAANWTFARRSARMQLLADASGNTPDVGTVVPVPGFIYEYALPPDCMKPRFVPWQPGDQANAVPTGNIAIPSTPLLTGQGTLPPMAGRIVPARFLVSSDYNYPPPQGQESWQGQGVSPQSRTVILTNVKNAELVYTSLVLYPSVWDSLFRAAMVAYLASEVALPIWAAKDPKFGLLMRNEQAKVVRSKVIEARLVDGNSSPDTSDLRVDWMDARKVGGAWAGGPANWGGGWDGIGGPGVFGMGYDSLTVAGAVF